MAGSPNVKPFIDEYERNRKILTDHTAVFDAPLDTTMAGLRGIMKKHGFDRKLGAMLVGLRGIMKDHEADSVLASIGAFVVSDKDPSRYAVKFSDLTTNQIKRAAVIKLLRHVYLEHVQGASEIWIVSTPRKYGNHVYRELKKAGKQIYRQYDKLEDIDEQFNKQQRRILADATGEAKRLVANTLIKLFMDVNSTSSRSYKLVKRWFVGAHATPNEVKSCIRELISGVKEIEKVINSNQLIFTDMPTLRHSTNAEDEKLARANAFVFANMFEKIPIIYIEKGFFNRPTHTMSERTQWANTVIHEITHLALNTADHRYRFEGLSPDYHMTSAQAIDNADSWSIFCADMAGTLTISQRDIILYGRSGKPNGPPIPQKIKSAPVAPPKIPKN